VWFTTPGAICDHVNSLAQNDPTFEPGSFA
jgi:hypothetical protein